MRLGASTRGGVALIGLAKARAAMDGRAYVRPDDILAVADAALAIGRIEERTVVPGVVARVAIVVQAEWVVVGRGQ